MLIPVKNYFTGRSHTFMVSLAILGALSLLALYSYGGARIFFGSGTYQLAGGAFLSLPVSADAFLVFDMETGEILGSKNKDTVYPIASVTKLVTAAATLSHNDLDATTTVSWTAFSTEGKAGELSYAEKLTKRELLFPLLLESSNDAAEVLAESVDRAEFVKEMNTYAQTIGMSHTTFVDPSGLEEGNTSTPLDLRTLLRHLYQQHPYILNITRLPTYIGENHTWHNSNPASLLIGFKGGKQGYTDEADRTLVALYEERFEDESVRPIGIVLLGSDDLKKDVTLLRGELWRTVHYTYGGF